jgi:5-methylcytosine-specific restriction protein A
MPTRPARRCTTPGCPGRPDAGRGRCDACARRVDIRRGSPAARGYGRIWGRRSAAYLARHPFCVDCGKPATQTDHAPVSRRDLVAAGVVDPDADQWLQGRCTPCHSKRTVEVDGGFGNPATHSVPRSEAG